MVLTARPLTPPCWNICTEVRGYTPAPKAPTDVTWSHFNEYATHEDCDISALEVSERNDSE